MKKYFNKINILLVLAIVCIYILLANIFQNIRIPFRFLDIESTKAFNNCMNGLAISYLCGCFIYYLTIILKNKKERKRIFWEIHDLLEKYKQIPEIFEKEEYLRINCIPNDEIFSIYKKNEQIINEQLSSLLEKSFLYKDLLLEKEIFQLCEIRRLMGGLSYKTDTMTDDDKKICIGNVKDICSIIYDLVNNIEKEAQKKKDGEKS